MTVRKGAEDQSEAEQADSQLVWVQFAFHPAATESKA